jgi:hypothetical protein
MRDWLHWVQLGIVIALPSAFWALSTGRDSIGAMCGVLLMVLISINLCVSAVRNWQKWQKKTMSAEAPEVLSLDSDGKRSKLRD